MQPQSEQPYRNSCDFAVSPQVVDYPKDTQTMHKNTSEISEDVLWTCRRVLNYSVLLMTCLDRNGAGTGAVV